MSEIVRIEGARKTFRRGAEEVHALDGIDLELAEGEYLAVVGPSGSGKTTLLNMIGCVDRPSGGTVNVRGMETERLTDKALATIRSTTIGFVFQQFYLVPTLTSVENVMLPGWFCARQPGDVEARARKLLAQVGLKERADHYPSELSGGEMQRVALARALVNEPEILLADEPTGNLDSESAADVSKILRRLNERGLTIVVVTHNPDLAADATCVIDLKDGSIVDMRRQKPLPEQGGGRADEPLLPEASKRVLKGAGEGDAKTCAGAEPADVPEYMPRALLKRTWGSWRVAGLMLVLGGLMCSAAAMRFVGDRTGVWLLGQSLFILRVYGGNELTRSFSGTPALIFTGLWPLVLGAVVAAAGILFVLNRKLASGWLAAVAGSIATVAALVNIVMSLALLDPDATIGFAGMRPGPGSYLLLATALAALALGVIIILRQRRDSPGSATG